MSAREMRRRSVMMGLPIAHLPRCVLPSRGGSARQLRFLGAAAAHDADRRGGGERERPLHARDLAGAAVDHDLHGPPRPLGASEVEDRKSTRLNSSHLGISYAV